MFRCYHLCKLGYTGELRQNDVLNEDVFVVNYSTNLTKGNDEHSIFEKLTTITTELNRDTDEDDD